MDISICELFNEINDIKKNNKKKLEDSSENIQNSLIKDEINCLTESVNSILLSKDKFVENIVKNFSAGLNI